MADFINTIDVLGDDAVIDSIIDRSITEFKDNALTDIGMSAFYGCAVLETVELPNVTQIASSAFENCPSLTSVSMQCLKTATGLKCFAGCKSLTKVDMPNLEVVAINMFYGCNALSSLEMSKITAFSANGLSFTAIEAVKAPLVNVLEYDALRMMEKLRIVDLQACAKIYGRAFYGSGSLATLILRSETMCTLTSTNAFNGTYDGNTPQIARGNGYIYVPRALVDSYKAATNWSTYATQFRALEDYTVDGTTTGELDETKI